MEGPGSGRAHIVAPLLKGLSFQMQVCRFTIGVGHPLDSAMLHTGFDTEFFPFVESLTEFALNVSLLFMFDVLLEQSIMDIHSLLYVLPLI